MSSLVLIVLIYLNIINIYNLTGIVADIVVDPNFTPVAQSYRRLPIHVEDDVDRQLDELLALDICELVNEPSPWVSRLTLAVKNDGTYRICVDMREPNKAIVRERHPLPTFDELCTMFYGCDTFSTLDVKNAFHQVEISENSRGITTFITKRGLMRFKRLIFGVCNAPELFQKIMEQILAGLDGVANYMDDIIVFGKGTEDHDQKLQALMKRLEEYEVKLNDSKCKFRQSELVFMGHLISKLGTRPCDSSAETLEKMRLPAIKEELDSFLGFALYHGRFIKDLATKVDPLRMMSKECQSKKSAVTWNQTAKEQFLVIKDSLKGKEVHGFFNKHDETILEVDASPVGLGAILSQKNSEGVERVIMFASKTLADVERRYSQTEKEALAIVWGVERFQYYLQGCHFTLITDHKPLVFMFQPRAKPCARIERWILRLQAFRYTVQYRKGSLNRADTLSRIAATDIDPVPFDEDAEHFVLRIIDEDATKAVTEKEIQEANTNDKEFNDIENALVSDIWDGPCKQWRYLSGEFSIQENILLRGDRIYIPELLRSRVLDAAHESHFGRTKMLANLRSCVWWPSMTKDIEDLLKKCKSCLMVSQPDRHIPLKMRELPRGPGQELAFDFEDAGKFNKEILVGTDYYSRYCHLAIQTSTGADETIRNMQLMFAKFSWPYSITVDNGPPFNSAEFKHFCDTYAIKLMFTPPKWAQANGLVERMNKNIKKQLIICWNENKKDWQYHLQVTYLSSYHSSIHSVTGKTPFEMMFNRKMRTKLPSLQVDLRGADDEVREHDTTEKQKIKDRADKTRRAVESEIQVGDTVLLKNDQKEHKLISNFGVDEFVVVEKKGGDCVIESELKGKKRRQVTHLKKVFKDTNALTSPPQQTKPMQSSSLPFHQSRLSPQPSTSHHHSSESRRSPSSGPISSPPPPANLKRQLTSSPEDSVQNNDQGYSRPKRARVAPGWTKDYVKNVNNENTEKKKKKK